MSRTDGAGVVDGRPRHRTRTRESREDTRARRLVLATIVVAVFAVMLSAGLVGFAGAQTTTAPDCNFTYNGNGTVSDPHQVENASQLQCMGNTTDTTLGDNFTLVTDIDASGTDQWNGGDGFDPVGDSTTAFTGSFNGSGYTISNLTINRTDEDNVGLFGWVGSGGTITNTSLEDTTVNGSSWVGSVVGSNYGTVTETYATGSVNGSVKDVGGLVGRNDGTVEDSYATSSVIQTNSTVSDSGTGGLVGENDNNGQITTSYAAGNVSADGDAVGGLVGKNKNTVTDAYWDVDATGQDTSAGGTGLQTLEMKGDAARTNMAGFGFTNTWSILDDSTGGNAVSYPYLSNNSQQPEPGRETLYAGGDGTAGSPYTVSNWTHLDNVRGNLGANFTVSSGLDQNSDGYNSVASSTANGGDGFDPIGDSTTGFTGTFDGSAYPIENLTIDRGSTDYVGLFGHVSTEGTVTNTAVENADVTGANQVGSLAGHSEGTVTSSNATGNVTGTSDVGGLVGANGDAGSGGTVANASASVNVTATGSGSDIGGLVGQSHDGTIKDSNATGDVTAPSATNVGGLVGYNYIPLEPAPTTVQRSYATGSVEGDTNVGGLVGTNENDLVTNTYATGSVSGNDTVGGLVGENLNGGLINNSYATGVVSESENVGGLVGSNSATVEDSYWDVNTTGQGSSDGGTGLTTFEMKGEAAETNMAGFEFTNTWAVVNTTANVSYPYLQNNTQTPAPGLGVNYAGGDGTASNPYEIANWHHLNNTRKNLDANFTLANDLDESAAGYDSVANGSANGDSGFDPIGDSTTAFTGTFDGSGHTVRNLTVNRSDEDNVGLFGLLKTDGVLRDVHLENTTVTGRNNVGGLVGRSEETVTGSSAAGNVTGENNVGVLVGSNGVGTVENSSASGNATGTDDVGGFVGENGGSVENSSASVDVAGNSQVGGLVGRTAPGSVETSSASGNVTGDSEVGGLVGGNVGGTVANSSASGTVAGNQEVGGLVGWNGGLAGSTVENSSASGTVTTTDAADPKDIGGLVGRSADGTIRDSNATGKVNATDADRVGGLIGYNTVEVPTTVQRSYATGAVEGNIRVGGLVGKNEDDLVTNAYATGAVNGTNYVGGLVGENTGSAVINDSYATGVVRQSGVTELEPAVGGLVGGNGETATVEDSYWDVETTNQSTSAGLPDGNGLTTSEMTGKDALDNMAAFDVPAAWHLTSSYPALDREDVPGFFLAEITATNGPVTAGETLTASADISNYGGSQATQTVTLTDSGFSDSQQDSTGVTLGSTESSSVDLTWATADSDVGTGTVQVATENDTADATVTVEEADQEEDDQEEGDQTTGDTEETIVESQQDGNRVNVTVTSAKAGEEIAVNLSVTAGSYNLTTLRLTPTVDGDFEMSLTVGDDPLESTPDAEFPNNATTGLAYVSVNTTLDDDEMEDVEFGYTVGAEQIEQLDSNPQAAGMYRFAPDVEQWERQNTTFRGEEDGELSFVTTADHLSEWTAATARPSFRITDATVDVETARTDETVVIDVFVENTGGTEGNYRADLLLNGEIVDSKQSVIAEGGQALFDFERTFDQPGTYEIQVNDEPITEIEVTDNSTTDDGSGDDGSTDDESADDGSAGGGNNTVLFLVVGVVIVVLAGGVLVLRRR